MGAPRGELICARLGPASVRCFPARARNAHWLVFQFETLTNSKSAGAARLGETRLRECESAVLRPTRCCAYVDSMRAFAR